MEILSLSIKLPLEVLIYTSVFFITITGVLLIKLLIDLLGLVGTLDNFIKATQGELEPTIQELKTALANINLIASNVSSQINNVNINVQKGAQAVLETAVIVGSRAISIGKSLGKNLKESFYLLLNSKK